MNNSIGGVNRRVFLQYVGAGMTGVFAAGLLGPLSRAALGESLEADAALNLGGARPWVNADGSPAWTPVSYPVPQPGDGGAASTDATRLASFDVQDDLVLPKGYRYDVVAQWGDRFGPPGDPTKQITFGFNADYTGLTPVAGTSDEFFMIVNHEYISGRPWLQGVEAVHGKKLVDEKDRVGGLPLVGTELDLADENWRKMANPGLLESLTDLCETAMSDLGISVLHVRRSGDGRFEVIKESDRHFRFTGCGSQNVPEENVFTSGGQPRLRRDFTGPAFMRLDTPVGTFANCSGATTPWGTFLTCEENFQDQVPEFVAPDGSPLKTAAGRKRFAGVGDSHASSLPFEFEGLGTGLRFRREQFDPEFPVLPQKLHVLTPLDGRGFGWVCEIDPVNRAMTKHTSLGRFRHENVAIRAERGKQLTCYMGDDRRGGHVWKFVSDGLIENPEDPANTDLLRDGTLYVAQWNADFSGTWIPLLPRTKLLKPTPEHCTGGNVWLPQRPDGGHVAVGTGEQATISVVQWIASVERYAGKPFDQMTVLDLTAAMDADVSERMKVISRFGIALMDAYAFANCVGGTPTARPEDIEVHPVDRSIYISFTDSTGNDDGSPDGRIFPDSVGKNSRQYGAIYRLAEKDNDPAATEFSWGKFVASGEAADGGGGFACADNLVFDPSVNLWMVCDITTPAHNFPVDRKDKSAPGASRFPGVFGNNSMFMIPTSGEHAGVPFCFATGPMECELTGPTFTADGRTLLVSVQHPGELNGTRNHPDIKQPSQEVRTMHLASRDGTVFMQQRTVPLGSNFPVNQPGGLPRPCVVQVTRQ